MNQENMDVRKAAESLAAKQFQSGYKWEALHEYTDASGQPLFWRMRLRCAQTGEKWIRPICRSADGLRLGEPDFGGAKPLYNLAQLSARRDGPVLFVEGEWCVDHLAALGILATTSGGTNTVGSRDWEPLAGRIVYLWPDADEAGIRHMEAVADTLAASAGRVEILCPEQLGLSHKEDAVEWLQKHPDATPAGLLEMLSAATRKNEPLPAEGGDIPLNEVPSDPTDKQSQAATVVKFISEQCELLHDPSGNVFAVDRTSGECRALFSKHLRDWALAGIYRDSGKSIRDQSFKEALSTLNGIGRFQGYEADVHLRCAHHEGGYYVDIASEGSCSAIAIKPGDWRIVERSPVHFLRQENMLALPLPVHGGSIDALWDIANIPDAEKTLVVTWLIDSLRPDTPFPVLELVGEQGSAKSTTQTALRMLVDPNTCNLRSVPKSPEDLFVGAGVNWMVSYENVSHLSSSLQDALCVLSTGGGFAKRKLFSDADEVVLDYKRPVVLNGISANVTAHDLIDRTISIELGRIQCREDSGRLRAEFERSRATILGGLLDLWVEALVRLPQVRIPPEKRPRMVEFARLGCALAPGLGQSQEQFMERFQQTQEAAIQRTLDASPVATALLEYLESRAGQVAKIRAQALFDAVSKHRPAGSLAWPCTAKGFSDALRRLAPSLRQLGVHCENLGKTGGYVYWCVGWASN